MASVSNVFVDHTFLIAYFADVDTNVTSLARHERCKILLEEFTSRPLPPRFITTNSELSRAITYVLRRSGRAEDTSTFVNRILSSTYPKIDVLILTRKTLIEALKEYRDIRSPYFTTRIQFLGLTSVMFMLHNPQYRLREAIAFDDKFVAAGSLANLIVRG